MITFLRVCLCLFAGCTVLGLLPPAVIAGKARQPALAVVPLLIVAFAIYVLVTAAVKL